MPIPPRKSLLHPFDDTPWGTTTLARRSRDLTPLYVDRYRGPHGGRASRHAYWELSCILNGSGELTGRHPLTLLPDTIVLIPPGYVHDEQGTDLDTLWIGLAGRRLSGLRRRFPRPRAVRNAELTRLAQQLYLLAEQRRAPIGPELDAMTAMLLHQFLRRLNEGPPRHPGDAWVERVIEAMDRELAKPHGMAGIARRCGCTLRHLDRVFKRHTGRTPLAYLIDRRMRQAAHLLDHTALPIQDVARRVGYENAFYFSRLFRRAMGQSPRAHRETGRERTG